MRRLPVIAAASALLATAVSAPAAATTVSSTAARGGYAPACVERTHGVRRDGNGHYWYVRLYNHCGRSVRVKVSLRGRPDTPCTTITDGDAYSRFGNGRKDPYQNTRSC